MDRIDGLAGLFNLLADTIWNPETLPVCKYILIIKYNARTK